MKIRGTKLTVAQMKTLKPLKLDLDSYLLKKIRVLDSSFGEGKRLSKESMKLEIWELINRESGDIKSIGVRKDGSVRNIILQ